MVLCWFSYVNVQVLAAAALHRKPGLQQILDSIRECAAGLVRMSSSDAFKASVAPVRWWKSFLHVFLRDKFLKRNERVKIEKSTKTLSFQPFRATARHRVCATHIHIYIHTYICIYIYVYKSLYYISFCGMRVRGMAFTATFVPRTWYQYSIRSSKLVYKWLRTCMYCTWMYFMYLYEWYSSSWYFSVQTCWGKFSASTSCFLGFW